MSKLRCGPLAAWASAWLAGTAAFDDVLTAVSVGAAAPALALAASGALTGRSSEASVGRVAQLGEVLITWRQTNAHPRLILPIPGDTRGLAGPDAFRTAALDAGQAVVGADTGVVPVLIDHHPSSAPPTLTWHTFEIERPVEDYVPFADAQYELTEAIRECASTIARLAQPAPAAVNGGLNDDLIAARRAGERINLPPGFPARAVALIAQAERMAAVLTLAEAGPANGADERSAALAPLVLAVRRARLAGYNATD